MKRKNKGITLISLVITIVIMLVLAGVAISIVIGKNGLFAKSNDSVNKYQEASKKELDEISNAENDIDNLDYNSDKINNVQISEKNISATSFTISVSLDGIASKYEVYDNDEKVKTIDSTENNLDIDVTDVEALSNNKVYIIAFDDKGKMKKSNELEIQTNEIVMLFKKGTTEGKTLTGGWHIINQGRPDQTTYYSGTLDSNGSFSFNSTTYERDGIECTARLKTTTSGVALCIPTTINKINLTNYSKICAKVNIKSFEAKDPFAAVVIYNTTQKNRDDCIYTEILRGAGEKNVSYDIQNLTDMHTIGFRVSTGLYEVDSIDAVLEELWLE